MIKDWTTVYPTNIDSYAQMPTLVNIADKTRVSQVLSMRDAVIHIEQIVGSDLIESGSIRFRVGALEDGYEWLVDGYEWLADGYVWLDGRCTIIEGDVATLQVDVSTLQGDVSTLQSDVSALQGDVSLLQSDVSTLQGDVSMLQGEVSTLNGNVSSLDGRVGQLEYVPPTTLTYYVDGYRSDYYAPEGTQKYPFLTIQSAIDAVPYLGPSFYPANIIIAPGQYNSELIILKDYVNLIGSGRESTSISCPLGHNITNSGEVHCTIRNLSIGSPSLDAYDSVHLVAGSGEQVYVDFYDCSINGLNSDSYGLYYDGGPSSLGYTNLYNTQIMSNRTIYSACLLNGTTAEFRQCEFIVNSSSLDNYYIFTDGTASVDIASDCTFGYPTDNPINTYSALNYIGTSSVIGNKSDVPGDRVTDALNNINTEISELEAGYGFRTWNVGSGEGMYSTIQSAIDAINLDPIPPDASHRCCIFIHPGYYTLTARLDIPAYVGVKGTSKGLVQLYNNTTNMFRPSGNNWFEDFLVEGAATTSLSVFDGNNASDVHIRRVDMLKNSGNCKQHFITQTGTSWKTWFVEDCIIDWYFTGGSPWYLVLFENTSGATRSVDVIMNNIFFDAFHLTDYGHQILVRNASDVRIRNSTIRGSATYHTGVRVENSGVSGTPEVHVRHSYLEGGVPVYGQASTNYYLINADAIGALTSGTRTMRNSSVT